MPEGGTHPRKGRVGLFWAGKLTLYLYKLAKNGVYSISFWPKIEAVLYFHGQTRGQNSQFCQKLGSKLKFWPIFTI